MNKLTQAKRVQVVAALVEGNSVRATCRMTGVAKGTVLKLLSVPKSVVKDFLTTGPKKMLDTCLSAQVYRRKKGGE